MNTSKYCGYSNCFRPFYKMRGFMPCCEFHYRHPKKWGEDGETYTGSVFVHKTEGKRMSESELTPKQKKALKELDRLFTKIAMDDSYWDEENDRKERDAKDEN